MDSRNIEYRPWLADSALMKTDSEEIGEATLCARPGLLLLAASSIPHSSLLSNLTLLMRLSAAESDAATALALLFTTTLDNFGGQ